MRHRVLPLWGNSCHQLSVSSDSSSVFAGEHIHTLRAKAEWHWKLQINTAGCRHTLCFTEREYKNAVQFVRMIQKKGINIQFWYRKHKLQLCVCTLVLFKEDRRSRRCIHWATCWNTAAGAAADWANDANPSLGPGQLTCGLMGEEGEFSIQLLTLTAADPDPHQSFSSSLQSLHHLSWLSVAHLPLLSFLCLSSHSPLFWFLPLVVWMLALYHVEQIYSSVTLLWMCSCCRMHRAAWKMLRLHVYRPSKQEVSCFYRGPVTTQSRYQGVGGLGPSPSYNLSQHGAACESQTAAEDDVSRQSVPVQCLNQDKKQPEHQEREASSV